MAISGFSGFSAAANAAAQMRARFDEASRISTTGERATTYAGLGADAGKAVDLATTSQSEADQKRGREIRREEERLGRERRLLEERCRKGRPLATDDCSLVAPR